MYRLAQKIYHSTAPSCVNHYKDATTNEEFGGKKGAAIGYSVTATATTIWKFIRRIILA